MTWSYGPSEGSSILSDGDRVRLLIGDTDEATALYSDEEISALLSLAGNVYGAAARAARSLSMRFVQSVDVKVGSKSVSLGALSNRYAELAVQYDLLASESSLAVPVFTGGTVVNPSDRRLWDQVGDASLPWWDWSVTDVEEVEP